MGKFLALLTVLAGLAVGAAVYTLYYGGAAQSPVQAVRKEESWLDGLYSRNPREAEQAQSRVAELGTAALPLVRATLQDPAASADRRKAALKACAILGVSAAALIPAAASQLRDPDLTAEAAVALSFMGAGAFAPLREAVSSDDSAVRREALRSIGKLRSRASLEASTVVPLLLAGMDDQDAGVRVVAATYLGILHEQPERSVPRLIDGLDDPALDVRRASATALGSFGGAAARAVPALRKAAADPDENLAREAGRSLIKVQGTDRSGR